jgi:heme exporter protein A
LLTPTAGQIYFEGKSIDEELKAYQRQLCFIGHKAGISPALTVRENCQYDLQSIGALKDWRYGIDSFSLSGLEDSPCSMLSAGQRRRVALLRLMRSETKLWLLDEPFVALDSQAVAFLTQQLLEHVDKGGAVVLTSHQSLDLSVDTYSEYIL